MDKAKVLSSLPMIKIDNLHDYYSSAPYWWPGSKPNVFDKREDSNTNPITSKIPDHTEINSVMNNVQTLALATYFTGNQQYAAKATQILTTWFLNPSTSMTPNVQHSQMQIGINTGRGTGIIDTHSLGQVLDAIGLLNGTTFWTSADQNGMKTWFQQYLNWLLTSSNGQTESQTINNHGNWYDVQAIAVASFLGDGKDAANLLLAAESRIKSTMNSDGTQPQEMARTNTEQYCGFNMTALYMLASESTNSVLSPEKNNLWTFVNGGKEPILQTIMDYLNVHGALGGGGGTWPDQQITEYDPAKIAGQVYQAAMLYGGGTLSHPNLKAYQRRMGNNEGIYPLLYGPIK